MTPEWLGERFAALCDVELLAPGGGQTAHRFENIFNAAQEDLSLAKLIEAHWDAVAILHEAGHMPAPGAKYAVWASETPGHALRLSESAGSCRITGTKHFCSGAGLVDRALMTAGDTGSCLVEVDLRAGPDRIAADRTGWQVDAFRMTDTATLTFDGYPVRAVVGRENWYVERPGFWMGACGPAAAWAGGAAGLVEYVQASKREDAHTLAHLGAMQAEVWAMQACIAAAGAEFDATGGVQNTEATLVRALQMRHVVEQGCTDILRRFARAMGPAPLAKNADIARRYTELDIFLRQSHAERDLESLGRLLRSQAAAARV